MMEAVENLALKNILLDAAAMEFEEELHEKDPVVISEHFKWQMCLFTGDGLYRFYLLYRLYLLFLAYFA